LEKSNDLWRKDVSDLVVDAVLAGDKSGYARGFAEATNGLRNGNKNSIHYSANCCLGKVEPYCGARRWYSVNNSWENVTCKKCLTKRDKHPKKKVSK